MTKKIRFIEDLIDHCVHEYDALGDYLDFILSCVQAVAEEPKSKGIILGGLDRVKPSMAANCVKGVRAAVFYNGPTEIVKLSREHNNASILSLGARFMSKDEIYDVIEMWLEEPFEGGRHQRRIDKLDE